MWQRSLGPNPHDFTGLKQIALWVSFILPLFLFMPQFSHHLISFSVLMVLSVMATLLTPRTKQCVSPLLSCRCHQRHWEGKVVHSACLIGSTVPPSYLPPASSKVPIRQDSEPNACGAQDWGPCCVSVEGI